MEAEARFNQGDFENAEILAHKAMLLAQQAMDQDIVFSAQYFMALISFMTGRIDRVMKIMGKMRDAVPEGKDNDFIHVVEICEGCIYAYLDQKDKIPPRLLAEDVGDIRLRFPAFPFFNVMYGRLLLITGQYLKLIGSSDHFIRIAAVFQNQLGYAYTYIYLAAGAKTPSMVGRAAIPILLPPAAPMPAPATTLSGPPLQLTPWETISSA
jgi:LuxR family transcriptional regulator, maltose regulon positive regulatory protein